MVNHWADVLAGQGVSAEVIDVAVLNPFDDTRILQSVGRTGRCVIVHEAARSGGFGGEIAARLADTGLVSLLAPVRRIAGFDTVMPMPRLEKHYMPDVGAIVGAARQSMDYA